MDGTQEANSEQAVEPRYLIRRTNPPTTQVETARPISNITIIFNVNPIRNLKQHVRKLEQNEHFEGPDDDDVKL